MPSTLSRIVLGLFEPWSFCTMNTFAVSSSSGTQARAASVVLPKTDDPAYASLETLLHHVLRAARGYMTWMCEVLELPDPQIRIPPEPVALAAEADSYMEHVLEKWRTPLQDVGDDRLETPEYQSRWQSRYCIDSMLEHAVMHPIRHAFQLEELMRQR